MGNTGHEIQDERYSVADDAIYNAFLLVLKEKDYDKITVADVIKRAGIVRSTFYNHYENISELINVVEDRTIQDIFTIMETFHAKSDREMCKSYFLTICEYITANPFLFRILQSPRGDTFIEKAITMFHQYAAEVMQNTAPSGHSKEEVSYMIACSIGSAIGVLHKWTVENCQAPAEVVADILTRVFMSGILPFMA